MVCIKTAGTFRPSDGMILYKIREERHFGPPPPVDRFNLLLTSNIAKVSHQTPDTDRRLLWQLGRNNYGWEALNRRSLWQSIGLDCHPILIFLPSASSRCMSRNARKA